MGTIFFEITIIICLATVLAVVFRLLKQPTILAYILTGVLVGPFALFHIQNKEILSNFFMFWSLFAIRQINRIGLSVSQS